MKKILITTGVAVLSSLNVIAATPQSQNYVETHETVVLSKSKAKCEQTVLKPVVEGNAKVNQTIERVIEKSIKESGCLSSDNDEYLEESDVYSSEKSFKIRFINSTVLVLEETSFSFLGGAHPDGAITPHVIDLSGNKNKEISKDEYFATEDLKERANKTIAKFIHDKSSKKYDLLFTTNGQKDQDMIDSCKGALEMYGSEFTLSPRKHGFVVKTQFPHAMAACDLNFMISYARILKEVPNSLSRSNVLTQLFYGNSK